MDYDISEITTLPKSLRLRLAAEGWQIARPAIARAFQSVDGTERYLMEFEGPAPKAETAEPSGCRRATAARRATQRTKRPRDQWRRATICVSSQVGCAVNCQFCLTAKLGLQRNLTAGEIAGQVVAVLDRHAVRVGRDRVNLVFMGMGEPFLNYDNFMAAVRLLVREVGLSPQRMTVSTSGIVPGIERFAQEPPDLRPKLAISLNAPNDQIRAEIMPINRKWPIAAVIDAVRRVPLRPRERITFEYVLLGGVTDRPEARPGSRTPRPPHRPSGQGQLDRMEPWPRHRLQHARTRMPLKHSRTRWSTKAFPPTCASPAAATSSPPAASSSAQWKDEFCYGESLAEFKSADSESILFARRDLKCFESSTTHPQMI